MSNSHMHPALVFPSHQGFAVIVIHVQHNTTTQQYTQQYNSFIEPISHYSEVQGLLTIQLQQ